MTYRRILILAAVCLGASACSDTTEPPPGVAPTLDNLWPNDNGRSWEFAVTHREWGHAWDTISYADSTLIPPPPDLDTLTRWIEHPEYPDSSDTYYFDVSLTFDGMDTLESGVVVQNLRRETSRPDGPGLYAWPRILTSAKWQKTDAMIGVYSGIEELVLHRVLLTSDVEIGAHFSHTSAFLGYTSDGWVVDEGPVETDIGTFSRAVRVRYRITTPFLGGSTVFQPRGHWYRIVSIGEVVFAPTVGPVRAYERHDIMLGDDQALGSREFEMRIVGLRGGVN